ncbi:hypothetical protein EW146_g7321 [Bondarzewia mesenterica]|uniref:Disintegrin and metalloproteinase domain-containing protein B n=1 Tax=Bondarzewia mesenterica TaxID=1095465 RepID=A0A4S4LRQ6_9AGAM|nr:hypothetical protein EW146_g7321 [Bondarzewia mesenterica]
MALFNRIHALAVVFLACLSVASGSSSAPRPLKRIAHPSTLAIEILPRHRLPSRSIDLHRNAFSPDSNTLHHTDSFRLTLSAFDDTFHLHLRPNEHLIHPSARITYYTTGPDGKSLPTHTEPLLPSSIKAYYGHVIPASLSPTRMRQDAAGVIARPDDALGWARIVVHDQGDSERGRAPVFEGAFSVRGVVHHIITKDNYLRGKLDLDPQALDGDPDASLVIWRDSDVMSVREHVAALEGRPVMLDDGDGVFGIGGPRTCGHDRLPWNTDNNPVLRKPAVSPWVDPFGFIESSYIDTFGKRDDVAGGGMSSNFSNVIGQTAGCPKTQKVIYMGVAADCEYVQTYGSQQNATQQILKVWNTASALYKSGYHRAPDPKFDVRCAPYLSPPSPHVPSEQSANRCPTTADASIPWNVDCSNVQLDQRLSLFSQWRGKKGNDGAGLWHLMSGCPTGTEVGIAWLATLCQQTASGDNSSTVSGTAVSTAGRVEWQVVAHETGHNFGAIHDCTDGCNSTTPCCPLSTSTCNANSQFIMSPVATDGEMQFSSCTLGNICSLIQGTSSAGKLNTSCLVDPSSSERTISLQMCGNGIVEDGEDCDPGVGSNSTCCDASTCKFTAGSVCDPDSSACCTGACQFAPATQVCRAAKDASCDTPEMCTGTSSSCPADVFAANGKSCGSNGLACASGQCTSLSQQCQQVGSSMGLTQACPSKDDKSCQVSCLDPNSSNQCIVLDSSLVDGSPCGYGGTCASGACRAGSLLDTAKAWYVENLQISIPVTVIVAIAAILILWGLVAGIRRCCTRGTKRPPPVSVPVLAGYRGERIPSFRGPVPGVAWNPQQQQQQQQAGPYPVIPGAPAHKRDGSRSVLRRESGGRSRWVDETLYNGPGA